MRLCQKFVDKKGGGVLGFCTWTGEASEKGGGRRRGSRADRGCDRAGPRGHWSSASIRRGVERARGMNPKP